MKFLAATFWTLTEVESNHTEIGLNMWFTAFISWSQILVLKMRKCSSTLHILYYHYYHYYKIIVVCPSVCLSVTGGQRKSFDLEAKTGACTH